MIKSINPMRPLKSTHLWILIFLLLTFLSNASADTTTEAVDRLRPIDTSSPRSLVESMQHQLISMKALFRKGRKIRHKVLDTIQIFDFTNIPPVLISQQGPEHLWQLIEIMDRLPKLDLEKIPDAKQVREQEITRWTVPGTELTIRSMTEGPRKGEFLISSETFNRIPGFYTRIADLPKRPDAIVPMDTYQLYRNGWGTVFKGVPSKFPELFKQDWLGQPGWKWLFLFLFLGGIALLARPFARLRPKHVDEPRDDDLALNVTLRRLVLPIYIMIAMQVFGHFVSQQLHLTGMALAVFRVGGQLIFLTALAYVLHLLLALMAEVVIKFLHTRRASFDSQLIRLAFRLLFWIITIIAIAIISEHIGVPVTAMAAGLGAAGLAVALATQSTLENLVAGLTIYGDRPIRIGDFCSIGGVSGYVENIGLRSTRIRTLERTLVTIPNAEVAKHNLENFSLRDRMLLQTTLGLRYETTPDQLRYILGRFRELFYSHPKVINKDMRVRFIGFGASSLDIEIYLYIRTNNKPVFLEICEDLNLRIIDILSEAGAAFAFPSQTAYLARDTAPDAERTRAAEAHVETWREAGELPFPDLPSETKDIVKNTLDYPPQGSPGNKR